MHSVYAQGVLTGCIHRMYSQGMYLAVDLPVAPSSRTLWLLVDRPNLVLVTEHLPRSSFDPIDMCIIGGWFDRMDRME